MYAEDFETFEKRGKGGSNRSDLSFAQKKAEREAKQRQRQAEKRYRKKTREEDPDNNS